jgi:hypothetical protein
VQTIPYEGDTSSPTSVRLFEGPERPDRGERDRPAALVQYTTNPHSGGQRCQELHPV